MLIGPLSLKTTHARAHTRVRPKAWDTNLHTTERSNQQRLTSKCTLALPCISSQVRSTVSRVTGKTAAIATPDDTAAIATPDDEGNAKNKKARLAAAAKRRQSLSMKTFLEQQGLDAFVEPIVVGKGISTLDDLHKRTKTQQKEIIHGSGMKFIHSRKFWDALQHGGHGDLDFDLQGFDKGREGTAIDEADEEKAKWMKNRAWLAETRRKVEAGELNEPPPR